MKKYQSYKSSGVEWIGEIPEKWELKRIKYLFTSIVEKSIDGSEELLSVSEKKGIVPRREIRDENEELTRSESLEGYLKVEKDDLVNNIMLMWKRGLGFSNYKGIVSPSYSVFRLNKPNVPSYWNYLLRTDLYVTEYRRNSTGVIDSRLRLYDDSFGEIYSILPPLSEQKQIVQYLDEKTDLIDKLISTKERKITLLKEQRTSLINQVVTKGLNPDVKMKDSGVEWIGEIPVGWGVFKMKYGVNHINQKGITSNDDIKISPENVESMTGICFNYYSEYEGEGMRFCKGDILLNKLRLYLKKIVFTEVDGYSMGEMIVLRCMENLYNRFFYYLIFHQGLIDLLDSQSNGVKLPRVSPEIILNSLIPFPSINEQLQIVEFLDEKTKEVDEMVSLEQKKINTLKEYRQSLISEVVTGKIKVTTD
jgi:type I restriction enzyme S subunit